MLNPSDSINNTVRRMIPNDASSEVESSNDQETLASWPEIDTYYQESPTHTHITPQYKAYKRRWYILIIYGLFTMVQGFFFNMWGPIFHSMRAVFDWTNTVLAGVVLAGAVIFVLFTVPLAWILERLKLRKMMILMTSFTMLSSIIRCFPCSNSLTTTFIVISSILNSFAGACTFFMPPVISSIWFPPKQRKFATAFGTLILGFGVAAAFVVGPLVVSEPSSGASIAQMKREYFQFTWAETAVSLAIFIVVLIYFPSSPPTPVSESSEVIRVQGSLGLKRLLLSTDFWFVATPATLVFGTYMAWSPVLTADLPYASQDTAAAIGFVSTFSGIVSGLVVGRLADHTGHLKAYLIAAVALGVESTLWLFLVKNGYIPFSVTQIYIAASFYAISGAVIISLNIELAVEVMYPIDEGIVVGVLGLLPNLIVSIFLIILMFPSAGHAWMDFFTLGTSVVALPITCFIREKYNRSAIDHNLQD